MNKKTIIQVAVIVVAFGLSGIVLYNGLSPKKTTSIPAPGPLTTPSVATGNAGGSPAGPGTSVAAPTLPGGQSTGAAPVANAATTPILPNGKSWNLPQVLNKQQLQFGQVQYPQLDANNDVGLSVDDLFSPLSASVTAR